MGIKGGPMRSDASSWVAWQAVRREKGVEGYDYLKKVDERVLFNGNLLRGGEANASLA